MMGYNVGSCKKILTGRIVISLFFTLLVGICGGLLGIGGGEFRIPILLYIVGLPVVQAVAVNLIIGLLTVSVSLAIRLFFGLICEDIILPSFVMMIASVMGARLGAKLSGKLPEKYLRLFLSVLLIVVGIRLISSAALRMDSFYFKVPIVVEMILVALVGFGIGIISGMLGVAGGEFRIPAFMYLFGLDIVSSGTASLLVSIPTIVSGLEKHNHIGHISRIHKFIAILMGLISVAGAMIGAIYASHVEKSVLEILLGIILILATVIIISKP